MRVDGLCDASPGVTKNHLDHRVVDSSGVQHGGQGVAALVWAVVHRQLLEDGVHGLLEIQVLELTHGLVMQPGEMPVRDVVSLLAGP